MKKVKIELSYMTHLAVYKVTRLVNCATFTPSNTRNIKMIGSTVEPREAEALAMDRRFEVTITEAK